jgi:hypothetical protein
MPGTWDEEPTIHDDMDINFPLRPSPVPTELVSTADNSDWNEALSNNLNNSQEDQVAMVEVRN